MFATSRNHKRIRDKNRLRSRVKTGSPHDTHRLGPHVFTGSDHVMTGSDHVCSIRPRPTVNLLRHVARWQQGIRCHNEGLRFRRVRNNAVIAALVPEFRSTERPDYGSPAAPSAGTCQHVCRSASLPAGLQAWCPASHQSGWLPRHHASPQASRSASKHSCLPAGCKRATVENNGHRFRKQ